MTRTPEERRADYDPRCRYRVYTVTNPDGFVAARRGPQRELAGCESSDGIGLMLVTLHEDGDTIGVRVGLMDTEPWRDGEPGVWLIDPYVR